MEKLIRIFAIAVSVVFTVSLLYFVMFLISVKVKDGHIITIMILSIPWVIRIENTITKAIWK